MFVVACLIAAYLIGAIPIGYLIARAKGVDLFKAGSGNIGATNVGRVIGRKYGILVFVLDFLKGAVPVALVPALRSIGTEGILIKQFPADNIELNWLRVGVALSAFVGHMFPVYLGFCGGKGVATGFGTVCVLDPMAASIAILIWIVVVVSTRMISLGSIAAVVTLCIARIATSSGSSSAWIITGYFIAGACLVLIKHRANIARIVKRQENRLEERPMFDFLQRASHLLTLGLWLGSVFFFNLIAAPLIFASFAEVAKAEPSDRTAFVNITAAINEPDADKVNAKKKDLGNALAGTAVGPIFPAFFGLQAICGAIALITALSWWKHPGNVNRRRVIVIAIALLMVIVSWLVSQKVAELRPLRFSQETSIAEAAKANFEMWHFVSLGLSMLTIVLVFAAMVMAARLPASESADAVRENPA